MAEAGEVSDRGAVATEGETEGVWSVACGSNVSSSIGTTLADVPVAVDGVIRSIKGSASVNRPKCNKVEKPVKIGQRKGGSRCRDQGESVLGEGTAMRCTTDSIRGTPST